MLSYIGLLYGNELSAVLLSPSIFSKGGFMRDTSNVDMTCGVKPDTTQYMFVCAYYVCEIAM